MKIRHTGPLSGCELRVEIPQKVENISPLDWAPRDSDCLITALRATPHELSPRASGGRQLYQALTKFAILIETTVVRS